MCVWFLFLQRVLFFMLFFVSSLLFSVPASMSRERETWTLHVCSESVDVDDRRPMPWTIEHHCVSVESWTETLNLLGRWKIGASRERLNCVWTGELHLANLVLMRETSGATENFEKLRTSAAGKQPRRWRSTQKSWKPQFFHRREFFCILFFLSLALFSRNESCARLSERREEIAEFIISRFISREEIELCRFIFFFGRESRSKSLASVFYNLITDLSSWKRIKSIISHTNWTFFDAFMCMKYEICARHLGVFTSKSNDRVQQQWREI